jgi:hypothetical protein
MNLSEIAFHRLRNQQIPNCQYDRVTDLIRWLGAIQAQDYGQSIWAIGVRLSGLQRKDVELALNKAEILRTHVLRPTWHIVPGQDIYWMMELTAPRIMATMKTYLKGGDLTSAVITKAIDIILDSLSGGVHLTREELAGELKKAKIATDENRASNILMYAELEALICSGVIRGNKQTYALLGERVPVKKSLTREEALAELAGRYFSSHGPATVKDFAWWSGLTVNDARDGLELVKTEFECEHTDGETYWFSAPILPLIEEKNGLYLLPGFDEFIIGYTNRSASVTASHLKKVVGVNGIFPPVIVRNGKVIGVWRRNFQKNKLRITQEWFKTPGNQTRIRFEKRARAFGNFYETEIELIQPFVEANRSEARRSQFKAK